MSNIIKEIEIILENCEIFTVSNEHIIQFEVAELSKSETGYSRLGYVEICIESSANTEREFCSELMFERMARHNDITAIEIHDFSGTSELYYVNYVGDETNALQRTQILPSGDLHILITDRFI